MTDIVRYVSKEDLVKAVGKKWEEIIKDLQTDGLIKSYTEMLEIKLDPQIAVHFQTALEFYKVREVSARPLKTTNNIED